MLTQQQPSCKWKCSLCRPQPAGAGGDATWPLFPPFLSPAMPLLAKPKWSWRRGEPRSCGLQKSAFMGQERYEKDETGAGRRCSHIELISQLSVIGIRNGSEAGLGIIPNSQGSLPRK